MKAVNRFLFLLQLLCCWTAVYSQDCDNYLRQATELLSQKNYCDAKSYYQMYSHCNADADISTEIAICNRFITIQKLNCDKSEPPTKPNSPLVSFAASLMAGISNGPTGQLTENLGIETYMILNYCQWFGQDIKVGFYANPGYKINKAIDYSGNFQLQMQYGIACITIPFWQNKWAFRANYHLGAGYSWDSKKFGLSDDLDIGLRYSKKYFGFFRNHQENVYSNGLSCIVYGIRLGINY